MKYLELLKKLGKRQKAYILGFIAVAGVLLWAFISAGILTHGFTRDMVKDKSESQQLEVEGIILTETKDDQKYWEIFGETGKYSSDDKVALLNNVIGNFYKDNEVTMSFESSKGTYNEEKNQIILYENTHIVIKDGTTLLADRLTWSGSDKDIVAQGNVRINRNDELNASADKIIISPNYDKFKIIGNTTSKLFDSKEKKRK
jgi:LPS export ABC transporter protein LptC